ncbi:MAG: hypothetical protein ACOYB4_02735 [Methyloceanibacter sp.]
MTFIASALDALANPLQDPLTRGLMVVTFVFGFIRTRWYWVAVLALAVAFSNVLANHGWSLGVGNAHIAGQSMLRMFVANGVLMLASYAIGFGLKTLFVLVSGPQLPPAERKRALTDPGNATAIALVGIAIAGGSFLLVNDWPSGGGLLASRICFDTGCLAYRWLLLIAFALILWAAHLKFGRRLH